MVQFLMVTLVNNQTYLFGCLSDLLCNSLVDRSGSLAGIDEKKYNISGIDGYLRLSADGLGKVSICKSSNTAGVYNITWDLGQAAGRGDPVPGDSRLVVND